MSESKVEGLVKHIAAAALLGASQKEIAQKYAINPKTVARVQRSKEYSEYLSKLAAESVGTARSLFRTQLTSLHDKAFKVLKELLESDNSKDKIEGLKLYYRGLGIDTEQQQQADTNIVVNLPGVPVSDKIVDTEVAHEYPIQDADYTDAIRDVEDQQP